MELRARPIGTFGKAGSSDSLCTSSSSIFLVVHTLCLLARDLTMANTSITRRPVMLASNVSLSVVDAVQLPSTNQLKVGSGLARSNVTRSTSPTKYDLFCGLTNSLSGGTETNESLHGRLALETQPSSIRTHVDYYYYMYIMHNSITSVLIYNAIVYDSLVNRESANMFAIVLCWSYILV